MVVENGTSLLGATSCEKLGLVKRTLAVREESDEVTVKDGRQCTLPEVKDQLSSLPFVYNIETKDDAVPVIKATRRVPVALRKPLKRELERMENLGVIHKQDEPCETIIVNKPCETVIVNKPNGDMRHIDPKYLNESIKSEQQQLPTREEIFSDI